MDRPTSSKRIASSSIFVFLLLTSSSIFFFFFFKFLTRYYSVEWLLENPKISLHIRINFLKRSKCLKRYFEDEYELIGVKVEFGTFLVGRIPSPDALKDRWLLDPLVWW